ncbi:XRE family transcriptional regulator [Bordetella bronchiseptica]|uniref:XRE family transcriptional regulator n=1 Tax=Bordetella bronchiseptica TaxID=518 RepID=UPI0013778344|nr:LexA family transcriptional regulator [Bordetella bronchiseptica]
MNRPTLNDVLAATLARFMEKTGHKQASLAKLSGVGQTTISLYLNPARRQPSKSGKVPSATFGEVEALAGALDVAPWDLLRPEGDEPTSNELARPPLAPRPSNWVDIEAAPYEFPMRIDGTAAPWEPGGKTPRQMEREGSLKLSLAESVMGNVVVGEPPAANDQLENVSELDDVRLSAGDGIEKLAGDQTCMIQFRRSFLRSVGADGGRARVVYAKGDSMEPVIRDGAALLVVPDEGLTLRDLVSGGVYTINYDSKMIVKAVAKDRLTGRWVPRSYNERYQDVPSESGAPMRVLGRVVGAAGVTDTAQPQYEAEH